jgi:hypothetical protein
MTTEKGKQYAQKLVGVDIFQTGKWNGDPYSTDDLDQMVLAFGSLPYKVPLKFGHTEAQRWFGQEDGAPALGWVDSLRRVGQKLVADIVGVPDAIVSLISQGNYRNKSAEIYWNYVDPAGKRWPRALKAVSLLGADIPAVTTLEDLARVLMSDEQRAVAYSEGGEGCLTKEYTLPQGGKEMSQEEIKRYTDEIEGLKTKVKELTDSFAKTKTDLEKSLSEMEARAVKSESELAGKDEKHAVAQFSEKVESLVKEGKVLPAEKDDLILQFVALGSGTKKYADKEFNPRELIVKSLEARKKLVNFRENGSGGETSSDDDPVSVKVDKMAQKIVFEKKVTYTEALASIKTEHPDVWAEYLKG